jgi:hypothetical protein
VANTPKRGIFPLQALVTSGHYDRLRDSGSTGAKILPLILGTFPEAGDTAAGSALGAMDLIALHTGFLP